MTRDLALRGGVIAAVAGLAAWLGGLLAQGAGGGVVLVAALGVVVTAGVGYLAFLGPARAITAVSRGAAQLGGGNLAERVHVDAAAVPDLVRSFNRMAEQLQDLFGNLAAEHARLQAVFEAADEGIVAVGQDSRIRFINPAALTLLGCGEADAVGRHLIESVRDYEIDDLVRRVVEAPGTNLAAIITFGPQRVPLRAAAMPVHAGGDWAALLVLTDLTDVQRIDQVRRDFVTNVSHELRTPLAAIRALAETLEEGGANDPADAAEFFRRIRQQVERLTLLVNELLDLSRIEAGAIELRPEPVDLAELLAEAASLLRTRSEAAGIRIETPPGAGPLVEADRASLLRVASNLLDNAIKFSPTGGTVRATVQEDGDLVAVRVHDEGPGIAEHEISRVFERFYKGDQARSGSAGSGLGLAIVKHLVRAHGGTAEAASPPGSGAVFTVRLPRSFVGARH